jgi:putative endopeptidase
VFDVADLDTAVSACADFDGFVNAKWIAANPIPADRTRWGAFDKLATKPQRPARDRRRPPRRRQGRARFDRAEDRLAVPLGMDEAAIEKAGFARSSRPRRIAR